MTDDYAREKALSGGRNPFRGEARHLLEEARQLILGAMLKIQEAERCTSEIDGGDTVNGLSDMNAEVQGMIRKMGFDPETYKRIAAE